MNRTERLNLRVTPALKEKVEQWANDEHRSVANVIEYILESWDDAQALRTRLAVLEARER